jgi:LAO/AO transport system kinase
MPELEQHLNPHFSKKNLAAIDVSELFTGIKKSDIASLSKGITLLESELTEHKEKANELLKLCLPLSGNSIRIGITGIPGAGKSTFIESIGKTIISEKNKLAILAIDPSSSLSKGSILGDKTRMEDLSRLPEVFIRPTPTSGNLGGVARATKESMILCEAAGFNIIMVETVGVGQSEIELHYLTDIFLLLLIPGAGDELQGIKRGIMEMADLILVNKAEGENANAAKQAVKQLENATHYLQQNKYGRSVSVRSMSALQNTGVKETWEKIKTDLETWKNNSSFNDKRKDQSVYWFDQSLNNGLKNIIQHRPDWKKVYDRLRSEIESGNLHPFIGADEMLNKILHK